MSRLGIAPPTFQETFSVCKLVYTGKRSKGYLSTFAFVYGELSRRVAIIEIMTERATVQRVRKTFCGFGPSSFQEVLDESNQLMKSDEAPKRLLCQEGISTLDEALTFVMSHLWGTHIEPPEVMGATEDAGELILQCFPAIR